MSDRAAIGRRDRNKVRTRAALVKAARTLAAERSLSRVTVEEIAELAGVSRRTFFNYFAGIEGLLVEATSTALEPLTEAFLRRPAEEDPLLAVIGALREHPVDMEILGWLPRDPQHAGADAVLHEQVWRHHEDRLVQVFGQRLGAGTDPLLLRTLAVTVMGLFAAVEAWWVTTTAGTAREPAVAAFNSALVRGLEYARSGWRTA